MEKRKNNILRDQIKLNETKVINESEIYKHLETGAMTTTNFNGLLNLQFFFFLMLEKVNVKNINVQKRK